LVSGQSTEEEKRASRRRLLKSALLLSAVGGLTIIAGAAMSTPEATPASRIALRTTPRNGSGGATAPTIEAPSASTPSGTSGASVKVKVMYFQMPQTIGTKEEYFVMQNPAYFSGLRQRIVEEHPALSAMFPTMMVLVDGVPAQPSTPLLDGDEVDLIPAIAGG
jgi:molybdopterin converting factor small subunit